MAHVDSFYRWLCSGWREFLTIWTCLPLAAPHCDPSVSGLMMTLVCFRAPQREYELADMSQCRAAGIASVRFPETSLPTVY